jgi:hypothetical protein
VVSRHVTMAFHFIGLIKCIELAILEWIIAFGYTFYLLTFAYDLRLSKGVHKYELSGVEPSKPPPAMREHHHHHHHHHSGRHNRV